MLENRITVRRCRSRRRSAQDISAGAQVTPQLCGRPLVLRNPINHGSTQRRSWRVDAMIDETLRSLAGAATHRIRTLPLLGELFGGRTRLDLHGRVVFITGAARGLGAEIARQAHGRGAYVAVVGRRLDPLQELANGLGDRAAAFQADVTDFAALQGAARDTVHRFGGIDVVVSNAGVAPPSDTVASIEPAEFERTVDIDLLGQWRTIRATLPQVADRHGHVLVVGSIYAFFNGA